LVGSLPAVPVATPWWQDIEPVVRAVRDHHGIDVVILRLLEAELDQPHGGRVTYLAEVAHPVGAERWNGGLDEHPRRQAFARPGGPAADLAWARALLAERGLRPTGPPTQVRTWNLSSLWRVPVEGKTAWLETAWLKVVPDFFAHEGTLLAVMAEAPVPTVLSHQRGRLLLAEIAGEDLYAAEPGLLAEMVNLLVELQRRWRGRVDELLALGLPDWRAAALSGAIADVVERTRDEISAPDRATLADFVRGLPGRFDAVAGCGLSDSLVHGDFHPGNFRGDGRTLTLLDWGDSGVGHPLLDQPAFLDAIPQQAAAHWLQQWSEAVPGSYPARAEVAEPDGRSAARGKPAEGLRFRRPVCVRPADELQVSRVCKIANLQNGISSSMSLRPPPPAATARRGAAVDGPPDPKSPPDSSGPKLPPPPLRPSSMVSVELKPCSTTSVEYFSTPAWSVHLRVCSAPSI
jgi:phosphotransferase family enzyme